MKPFHALNVELCRTEFYELLFRLRDVQVYTTKRPNREYSEIGEIVVNIPIRGVGPLLIPLAQSRAKQVGANAIIILERQSSDGTPSKKLSAEEMMFYNLTVLEAMRINLARGATERRQAINRLKAIAIRFTY